MKLFTRVDLETTKATLNIYRRELQADKRRLIGAGVMIPVANAALTVVIPLLLSLIIQTLVTHPGNLTTIYWYIGGIAAASITTVLLNDRGFTWLFDHEEFMSSRLVKVSMEHLLLRSHAFFANHKVGSLTGDIIAFSRSYMTILDSLFLNAVSVMVNFIASLIIVAFLAPVLLVPLVLLTGTIIYMSLQSLSKRSPLRNERKRLTSILNGTIADVIGNNLLVRIFARSEHEQKSIMSERKKIEEIAQKEIHLIQREANLRYIVLTGFQITTIGLCVWLFANGSMGIAAIIFTITYLGRVTGSLFSITGFIRQLEQSFLDAAPITRIMQESTEVNNARDAHTLTVKDGSITFDSVRFEYSDAVGDAVFKNLSLTIPAGQRIGLAGQSGGGKTTLTQLLLRFADLQSGSISIDGSDISKVTMKTLHENISYVPQDPLLFHRSLKENIAYGKPDASDKEIIEAAKKAYAWEFIEKLPNGLETIVGERGVKLSGGQRQRITIARAILKNAPILVLDEATSALDSESEKLIQASLTELMKGRTSVVIAHRLSTISKLDRIIVLDEGKIVEDGTHDELLAKNGTYARLWAHQSGGFIEE